MRKWQITFEQESAARLHRLAAEHLKSGALEWVEWYQYRSALVSHYARAGLFAKLKSKPEGDAPQCPAKFRLGR